MTFHIKIKQKGQVVVLVALALILLILFTGLALDSGIAFAVKAKLYAAVDAATLAAGESLGQGGTDPERIANARAAAERFFAGNFPTGYFRATPSAPDITIEHNIAEGVWDITVSATADVPTFFMWLGGVDTLTPYAEAAAERKDLDLMLVLDTSGSLNNPSDAFPKLIAASKDFVDRFIDGAGGDRLGLISFASGAEINIPINKDATRGFVKADVITAIDNLGGPSGSTASEEAFRLAFSELEAVPVAFRSSLRVIVFFSDGAPNTVAANYDNGGTSVLGDLYSWTSPGGPPYRMFRLDRRNTDLPNANNISVLPEKDHSDSINFFSFNNIRTLTDPSPGSSGANTRCNLNKAARNMVENVANQARNQDIVVITLGLGNRLQTLEITFCGYLLATEKGENILKRLANTTDVDTYNPGQEGGLYVFAENPDDLQGAFDRIASFILRLTR